VPARRQRQGRALLVRRSLTVALLASLAFAAPAHALDPAPTVITFNGGATSAGAGRFDTGCPSAPVMQNGGRDGGPYFPDCSGTVSFNTPQAIVELFVRVHSGNVTFTPCPPGEAPCQTPITRTPAPDVWTPVVLEASSTSSISFVEISTADVDDIAFSPFSQPDTEITSAPPARTDATSATFTFTSNVAATGFFCRLDNQDSAPCSTPLTLTGLAPGAHSLVVMAQDVYGAIDNRSPAQYGWSVTVSDRDTDGVPDATDNCPSTMNSDQADSDKDGVGNACEVLPPGNKPPEAGKTAVVKLLSGDVFVKLPARTALGFDGMRAPFQDTGFVPLKGVASLPVGSTVDARRGELEVQSAANGYAANDRRARRTEARIRAGMFAIKQAKRKQKAKKSASISTDIGLVTPAGAATACAASKTSKGVVRSLSLVAKGVLRTLGGAADTTAKDATFITTDRCDGTLTQVGKGKVSVAVEGRKKPITVRSGQGYFVKARLFAAKKGRRRG
jgi:hypothetical protein